MAKAKQAKQLTITTCFAAVAKKLGCSQTHLKSLADRIGLVWWIGVPSDGSTDGTTRRIFPTAEAQRLEEAYRLEMSAISKAR